MNNKLYTIIDTCRATGAQELPNAPRLPKEECEKLLDWYESQYPLSVLAIVPFNANETGQLEVGLDVYYGNALYTVTEALADGRYKIVSFWNKKLKRTVTRQQVVVKEFTQRDKNRIEYATARAYDRYAGGRV